VVGDHQPDERQDGQHQKKAAARTAECRAQPKDHASVTGHGN
jgi:hypothetical protein